eukprot:11200800-Lingulodinium_polyedra.AAC.1
MALRQANSRHAAIGSGRAPDWSLSSRAHQRRSSKTESAGLSASSCQPARAAARSTIAGLACVRREGSR